ncbi:MAG: hypothetical protein HY020_00505 [Burkholderiales bacterium]|nr:hypothetical protein [Burkholderiales bacterium]
MKNMRTYLDQSPAIAIPAGCIPARPAGWRRQVIGICATCLTLASAAPALALDGCELLLCLAAPSWRAVAQCVPPVTQALRDLARGKLFPACAMAGNGNTASHAWADGANFCPPQYTRTADGPNGPVYSCQYTGAITVTVQGTPFTRTWWSAAGEAVTEFSPAAKAQLGSWDPRFEDDYTAWLASRPSLANSID